MPQVTSEQIAALDPYYEAVTLLLPGDSTTVSRDWSAQAMRPFGGVATTGTALVLDGSADYVQGPAKQMALGTRDFCVEACVTLAALPIADDWPSTWYNHMVVVENSTQYAGDGVAMLVGATRLILHSNDTQMVSGIHGLEVGVRKHLAITREGTMLRAFAGGVLVGTASTNSAMGTGNFTWVGCETGEGAWFNGQIDNLRVTLDIARYTDTFTPPTQEFPWLPKRVCTTRGFSSTMGRTNPSPDQAKDAIGVRQRFHNHLTKNTVQFDGQGQITGTVKNAPATPVRRRVVLIDEVTRKTARETWSDAITGAYSFTNVEMGRAYTVLSYDHTQAFRAVVADRVVPELILEQSP